MDDIERELDELKKDIAATEHRSHSLSIDQLDEKMQEWINAVHFIKDEYTQYHKETG